MKGKYSHYIIASSILYVLLMMPAYAGVIENLQVSDKCRSGDCSVEEKENLEIKSYCHKRPDLCDAKKSRLTTYQPNYAIYQKTDDDESSIEVHYSFRYKFTKPHCMPLRLLGKGQKDRPEIDCLKNYRSRWETYFSFTGEFDFYVGTRNSGPVINRISNPAFHYRKYYDNPLSDKSFSFEWLNIGLEHRSNGQVIEADEVIKDTGSADFGRYRAQVELEAGNHEYFDALSRGANYISFEGKMKIGNMKSSPSSCDKMASCINTWISAKLYINDDSDVYWGPLANSGANIADYDRIRIIVSDRFSTSFKSFPEVEVGVEWRIGDEMLDTDSYDISVSFPWVPANSVKIPLYVRAHFGPMSTLSDYTKEQNSIGIGIKFR